MKNKFKIIDAGVPVGTSSGEKLKLGEGRYSNQESIC